MRYVGWTVLVVLVLAALVAGGQQAGFWLQHNQTEFESRNFRNSYANQERLREDVSEKIGSITEIEAEIAQLVAGKDDQEIEALEAQARAETNIVCHDAEQVRQGLPQEQAMYVSTRCEFGSVAP